MIMLNIDVGNDGKDLMKMQNSEYGNSMFGWNASGIMGGMDVAGRRPADR